jgi:hypothetical protein
MASLSFIHGNIRIKIYNTLDSVRGGEIRLFSLESLGFVFRSFLDEEISQMAKRTFEHPAIGKTIKKCDYLAILDILSKASNYLAYGMTAPMNPMRVMGILERDHDMSVRKKSIWVGFAICSRVSGRIIGRAGFRPGFSSKHNNSHKIDSYKASFGSLDKHNITEIQIDDFLEYEKLNFYPEMMHCLLVAGKFFIAQGETIKGERVKRFIVTVKNITGGGKFSDEEVIRRRFRCLKFIFGEPLGKILKKKEDERNLFPYEFFVFGSDVDKLEDCILAAWQLSDSFLG